ncbi:apolipoprotein N-acyltransferase [Methylophaga thalassica]|uniref:apolipoprotein N-acyltransferase n=1 Tax=Methylophaga aminisulfidivorans TaxID=230105 RepID=UPI0024E19E64|nr:apolipoprotein N-acyltransferase [Methylophaga aminisulfidivorans]
MQKNNGLTMQGWKGHIVALFGGAILPLAFSPFNAYPIAVLSLILLFASWDNTTAKQAAWRGWLFGLGMFGVGVSWVYVAIHVFGHTSWFLAGMLTFLFVAILASYLALFGWLVKKLSSYTFSLFDIALLLPIAWFGFELFKAWFLSGFPWLELGVSQIEGPLAGWVPVIGVNAVSFLVALTASCLFILFKYKQQLWILPVVVIWVGGQGLQSVDWTRAAGEPIKTTIVQGNVPQDVKWSPEQLVSTLTLYQQLTEQHWDSQLVVWPENAVPAFYHQLKDFYIDPLINEAQQHNTDILLGLPVEDKNGQDYYNSMMVAGQDEGFYHKRHLVPFGDYVPFAWLRGLIAFFDLPMSGFVPGPEQQSLLKASGQQVGISICYEDVFSLEVLDALPQASILINATNNAWYGDSFAPHQHLQISRSRALETERPLVRATTNGISAFVDYKGRIQSQTAQFEQATLTADIQPRQGATPYVIAKRWPVFMLMLLMLLSWFYYHRKTDST